MLQPCLKIWKLELIFGRVAITLPGVRSPLSRLLENDCAVCTRPKGHLISEGLFGVIISTKKTMIFLRISASALASKEFKLKNIYII